MLSPRRPYLIHDLVEPILNSTEHWWPCDLTRLAQVSSSWLHPVRRFLYAAPRITTFRSCSCLARTLEGNPALLRYIKGIELCPTSTDEDSVTRDKARADVRFILGICGPSSITLGGELASVAGRLLFAISDPESVQELHIDGRQSSRASLEWDESFSFRFSNIKKLRLTNLELEIFPTSFPSSIKSVQQLVLDNVSLRGGYLSHVFSELSPLRKLFVRSENDADATIYVRDALIRCMVEELEYEVQSDSASPFPLEDDMPDLTSLRSLRLFGFDVDCDSLAFLQAKCPNLVELVVVSRGTAVHPVEWISFIEGNALPSLRHLGLPWGTKHPPFIRWPQSMENTICMIASLKGIDLLGKRESRSQR